MVIFISHVWKAIEDKTKASDIIEHYRQLSKEKLHVYTKKHNFNYIVQYRLFSCGERNRGISL